MFCFHKYGKVEEDGYQYCRKCGKARKPECDHNWETINVFDVKKFNHCTGVMGPVGQAYDQRCTKCGKIKRVEF